VHEQERSDADESDQAGGDHRDREIRSVVQMPPPSIGPCQQS
jgi:hypothetical protein